MKLLSGIDETLIDHLLPDVNFAVTYNLQRTTNIYKSILVFDIYILKPKFWLIDWGIESSSSE